MQWGGWRYTRFHVSYLFAWLGVGVLAGLLVGRSVYDLSGAGVAMAALVLLLIGFRSGRWWACVCIVAAGLLAGASRASSVDADYKMYDQLVGRTVVVAGKLTGDPQRTNDRQKIVLGAVMVDGSSLPGEIFVTVRENKQLKRGDTVQVRGVVKAGFASCGASLSAGTVQNIQRRPDAIRDIRERLASSLKTVVSEPMASLGLGFVVGQRSTLPDVLDEQLKVVGLTHIVVASGYNLTILVRFVMRLLSRHSRYLALVGSVSLVTLFVLFSGLSPSMNRAVIVSLLGLLAWYYGRRFHPLQLILFVAAATAFYNPMYVWSDLGWYLSFFAFAGILIVAPLIISTVYKRRTPTPFEQLVVETLSAEVMALPIIVFAFGTLPVFGLLANVLVGPLIPIAMALTALTGVISMTALPVAALAALPTMIVIGYMIAVVEWLSAVSFAEQVVGVGLGAVIFYYAAAAFIMWRVSYKSGYSFRTRDYRLEV